jgi:hypothetical protein
MADAWPGTLPQSPLAGTLAEQGQDNVLRGPAAQGAEGQRRALFTARAKTISFAMNMTSAQLATLATFYGTTLGSGVSRFEFEDPTTGATKEFAFLEPYQVQHVAADIFRVSISLIRKAE